MLPNQRIKEAEVNVKTYLAEGLLKKTPANKNIIKVFLSNARESLKVAEEINQQKISALWTIVCSYYAMYYHVNAVLNSTGFKVGDKIVHKVTSDALMVYVRSKLQSSLLEEYEETMEEAMSLAGSKADEIIESFDYERIKRSRIQYQTLEQDKQTKAATSLKRAKEFSKEMDKLLLENTAKKWNTGQE
ncbi:MAG: hypothetical protein ABIA93_06490 [Candidatus Woesearchaeota archaeon]